MEMSNPDQMAVKLSCYDLSPAQIVDIQYGTDVWIDPGELGAHFLVHASLSGRHSVWSGGVLRDMDDLHITSPGSRIKYHMTADCRNLTVRIPANAFEEYMSRVMNIPINQPLVFHPGGHASLDLPAVWRRLLYHSIEQINESPTLMANSRIQRQQSMMMVELLLSNHSNNYSDQIALYGNDISPWHVRRARDLIHGELEANISVTDIANRVGVSVRSLQNGFRQFLGVTPVGYIRRHRLEKLNQALLKSDADASVTELMLECGIMNFGRYAQHYRRQYGCLPSDTLRKRRRRPPG
jgi:AraC-like DNA-binding protein